MKYLTLLLLLMSVLAFHACSDDEKGELATVTTENAISTTLTTAVSGGNVISDGGTYVTAKGVCWDTLHNPTMENSNTNDGSGTGRFVSNLTGLTAHRTYYVRAYATNKAGIAYGDEISFTTINYATVTTASVSNITASSASCEGHVTSDGGSSVTARGVCWSTSQNPTTANSKTTDGSGTGAFSSSLTGLTANTTYYIRAYATNGAGTGYGS